ncbi:MAG TPA: TRAP transporter large permease subunit [Saprospiraceae bacterium]|nr:TRAP transporter large permease subunit [Saprospiraceae bacterium]
MEWIALLLFVLVFILILSGYPVAFVLGGIASIVGVTALGPEFFHFLPSRIMGVMSNTVLIAVPLFVYMGIMLEKSGIAETLLETMARLFGKMPGGLALSVIIVGTLLAASTGIVGATVIAMGLISLPTMLKRNYSPILATGTIAASGTLGQIIPPSVALILVASVLNVSVGDLYLAALVPGLLLVSCYMLYVIVLTRIHPELAPPMSASEGPELRGFEFVKKLTLAFLMPLFLIIAVLGSIFAGIASATEAAAVGAVGATLLTALQRKLNKKVLNEVMRGAMHLTCMVFLILLGATTFALVFRGLGGDRFLTDLILQSNLSPMIFLLIVMLVVFIAGFFIDFIEIIFIIVPVVAPVFVGMKMDMIWIGILIGLNLQTSFLTPPFGFSLFYLKGVSPPSVTTAHIYRGIIPFVIIQVMCLLLVLLFPEVVRLFNK